MVVVLKIEDSALTYLLDVLEDYRDRTHKGYEVLLQADGDTVNCSVCHNDALGEI